MKRAVSLMLAISGLLYAKTAPHFSGQTLGGGRLSLKDSLKPGRMTLVTFWATWCTACIEELKTVTMKLKSKADFPLDLLTVNVDLPETASDVKPTMKLYGFTFPVVLDPNHEIFARYQGDKSLPYSALVSTNGELIQSFQGYSESLLQQVEALAKSKKG